MFVDQFIVDKKETYSRRGSDCTLTNNGISSNGDRLDRNSGPYLDTNASEDRRESLAQINKIHSKVSGSQLPFFSKKRFNRFPRFNIFYKKGDQVEQSQYVLENTVSLNADFLKFLVDKRHMQNLQHQQQIKQRESQQRGTITTNGKGEGRPGSTLRKSVTTHISPNQTGETFDLNELA